ncbi:glycoside hydrolase family 20 protein [Streptomyces sp. NPDC058373]|uniref:beta-N-acetylhexosaminidase n=1 Tax=unclassified Streptomyces TaxID=2593676 RepID=UPI00364DEBD1
MDADRPREPQDPEGPGTPGGGSSPARPHGHRRPPGGGRARYLLGIAAVVVAGAAALTIAAWPHEDRAPDGSTPDSGAAEAPVRDPSSYPVSKEPGTVPSVREHEAARGPGWKPGDGSRVVIADGELADEGRLLARELGVDYGGEEEPERGDVRLDVEGDSRGGPQSYEMRVAGGQVRITAPDQAGVFYGTRTLKQALRTGSSAPEGVVKDAPAKPQRGFMLDIARKPYPAGWIEDRIREIGDLKYNQLSLHFSDDQAFRIESESHPEVVSDDHLTKDQVRRILKVAAERHITVVPEIDSPGHLGAVIEAHPDLQLRAADGDTPRGAIDIANPDSARIVDDLLKEYAELFKGSYWHLGADEYPALMAQDPEQSYPRLARAAREEHGQNARIEDLATSWVADRAATLRPFDRTLKVWNDGLFADTEVKPPKDLEVEYWTGKEIGARPPTEYLEEGFKVINMNDEYLYYVLGEPQTFTYPTGERIYREWTPRVLRGSEPVAARWDDDILGARFAVWGDIADARTTGQVADGIRMPLAALAEKVWNSGEPEPSWTEFRQLARKATGED